MFLKNLRDLKKEYRPKISRSMKGFSLIELLVVTTILGFIAAGISSLLANQMNISVYIDDKASRRDLKVELDRLLSTEASCVATLDALTIPLIGVDKDLGVLSIKDQAGNLAFSTNSFEGLNISNATLRNLDITNTATSGMTELTFNLERQKSRDGRQMLQGLSFKLNTTVDSATREITNCSTSSSSNEGQGCLRPVSVHLLINNGALNTVSVPSNIAAAEIILENYYRGGGSEGDPCSVNTRSVYLKFNTGELDPRLVSGRSFSAQLLPGNAGRSIMYNGLRVADHRTCQPNSDGNSISHQVFVTRDRLDSCRIASDPQPPSSGYGAAPRASLILYKYDSDI
jgi:prepilin-type N-terminal cleavage/methylation domain-containing protein